MTANQSTRVLRDPASLPAAAANPVLAIGNFDGVHRGHREVIARTCALATAMGKPSGVMTFEPHPISLFRPEDPPFRLTPSPLKEEFLAQTGVDLVIVMTFDRAFAGTDARDFEDGLLKQRLGVSGVLAGHDFHYGAKRSGSPETLKAAGARLGYAVEIVAPVSDAGAVISSSAIRQALMAGDVQAAAEALGRPYQVRSVVAHGEKIGRTIGYPTANLTLDPSNRLRHGIYAVRAHVDGQTHDAVASFGRRPTFDNGAPKLEVFLFDFQGDLYGRTMDVTFHGFIRDEAKFDTVEALVARMAVDCEQARAMLKAQPFALPKGLIQSGP